jgi:hypothetical protein
MRTRSPDCNLSWPLVTIISPGSTPSMIADTLTMTNGATEWIRCKAAYGPRNRRTPRSGMRIRTAPRAMNALWGLVIGVGRFDLTGEQRFSHQLGFGREYGSRDCSSHDVEHRVWSDEPSRGLAGAVPRHPARGRGASSRRAADLVLLIYRARNLVSPKLKGWEAIERDHHPGRYISIAP